MWSRCEYMFLCYSVLKYTRLSTICSLFYFFWLIFSEILSIFATVMRKTTETMEATKQFRGPLNDAQMSVMRLLGHMKTVEEVEELHKVISDYYRRKIDEGMDQLWESGEWSQQRIDQILKEDVHANKQQEYAD